LRSAATPVQFETSAGNTRVASIISTAPKTTFPALTRTMPRREYEKTDYNCRYSGRDVDRHLSAAFGVGRAGRREKTNLQL
jgi:hypothetical protein